MTNVDFWTDPVVSKQAQVWDDAYGDPIPDHAHEMGVLYQGDRVHVIELYPDGSHTWARFDMAKLAGENGLREFDERYNEWWVKVEHFYGDVEQPPAEPEDPTSAPTDAEIGRVVRYLFGL